MRKVEKVLAKLREVCYNESRKSICRTAVRRTRQIRKQMEIIMKLRAPAMPLITVDPYFSVWSFGDCLNHTETVHWTGRKNSLFGAVTVDGEELSFLGYRSAFHKMTQVYSDFNALSTRYTFECEKIRLFVRFMTPLLPDDLTLLSRPVSYMTVSYESRDERAHEVSVSLSADLTLCMKNAMDGESADVSYPVIDGMPTVKMRNKNGKPLCESGDDIKIDWGSFLLSVKDPSATWTEEKINWRPRAFRVTSRLPAGEERLFLFAYDDEYSIDYFGDLLRSLWNKDGQTIEEAVAAAAREYDLLAERADAFSDELVAKAYLAGGEKYADLCSLAYRQVIAAHKLAVTKEGELLFVSKECFSNGCAATVDVSYPSIPLFLCYAPELIKGMLRPIYRFARSEEWKYDFAPHDAGQYPILHRQVYNLDKKTGEYRLNGQMPVEECGNMIIMETNIALAEGNADFAASHYDLLHAWAEYLIRYGDDPEDQLCTDDFAGHLAHNCNLTLKAILGIAGMGILADMLGKKEEAEGYRATAKEKAESFMKRAANGDGSTRLAFDRPGSFSLKYNMVWDKLWGTNLFPAAFVRAELDSLQKRENRYGIPLDDRADYTKSDWLLWTATMADGNALFKKMITPLWRAYNESASRVPMTDWYDTVSGRQVEFQNRTVQGGLFIKMLSDAKILCR